MASVTTAGRFGRLYGLLDWPARLAAVNALWLLGTLAGLVVAGIAPATVAMCWLLREYAQGRTPSLWHGFWQQWRAQLAPAQLRLGLPLLTFVPLSFYVLAAYRSDALQVLTVPLAVLALGYLGTLMYLPTVLVHYAASATVSWKVAVVAAWRQPLVTLGAGAASAALMLVMAVLVPGALPFLAVSLPALIAVKAALRGFGRLG